MTTTFRDLYTKPGKARMRSWLWPDRRVTPAQARALREEHNETVNIAADALDLLHVLASRLSTTDDFHAALAAARELLVVVRPDGREAPPPAPPAAPAATPASLRDWMNEFPDFPVETMPAIPAAWTDTSWHNDTCPSFCITAGERDIMVWIDYADPDQREGGPDGERFSVTHGELGFGNQEQVLASDDWDAILAKVDELSTKATREFYGAD